MINSGEKEYISISDFLYMNVEDLKDDEEIKQKDFSYRKYVCSLELGDKKLDCGIHPEKRLSIIDCEERKYINDELSYDDIIFIIDHLLLNLVKLLKGNHPFLTVLSCYYLHDSKVINCKDNGYFLEEVFMKWLAAFSYDKIYMDIFKNDNKEFIKYIEKHDDQKKNFNKNKVADNKKDSNQDNNMEKKKKEEEEEKEIEIEKKSDTINIKYKNNNIHNDNICEENTYKNICEEDYVENKMFLFFQLFLIFYSSSSELIDYVITQNNFVHRDDYKCGLVNLNDCLLYHCRNRRAYILKNLFIIKRCFTKFFTQYEENKKKNKDIFYILKRIKFIIYFTSLLNQLIFDMCESNKDSIKENCKQILNCINSIDNDMNCNINEKGAVKNKMFKMIQEEEEEEKEKKKKKKLYFNKYFLMYKMTHVSKHVTKLTISEGYLFYKNIITDIQYIADYIKLINMKSSFFDIKNILHYLKFYSKSCNILIKCIFKCCLTQIIQVEKKEFAKFEKEYILTQQSKASKHLNNNKKNVESGKNNSCPIIANKFNTKNEKREDLESDKQKQNIYDDVEIFESDDETQKNIKNKKNKELKCFVSSFESELKDYYSIFFDLYQNHDIESVDSNELLNKKLLDNVKENIFVNMFLFLFYNESFIIIEELLKENEQFYVKNIIFNDLIYFGFSANLLMLFNNFAYTPDTLFYFVENELKIDTGYNYDKNIEHNDILKNIFCEKEMNKFVQLLRLNFGYLVNYMEKESSIVEIFDELENFIKQYDIIKWEEINGNINENQLNAHMSKDKLKGHLINKDKLSDYDSGDDYDYNSRHFYNNIKNNTIISSSFCYREFFKNEDEYKNFINITQKRMKFTILCKVFNLFSQYLEIVIKKIFKYSFLLPEREYSKLSNFHVDMRILYTLMKILTYNFKIYNMDKEIESIENYYTSILQTILIDYNCLGLYINLLSDQEYSFTYYVMSICYKELSYILQHGYNNINNTEDINKNKYSLYYFILYLYSDFLMTYFIYLSYTNKDSNKLEEDSFYLKHKGWSFSYPHYCKMDLYSFQLNKSLLISLFLTKYLKINMSRSSCLSHNNNDDFHIGLKKKIKNINEIKESYQNYKMLINKYSNLIMSKNSVPYKIRLFEKSDNNFDMQNYFKQYINEIDKYLKIIKHKYDSYSFINIYINALKANINSSYKKIPPFCFENISIFLNPDYEVVRNHPFFLSLQEKIKK
ncbi:hypothetical protein CYL21_1169 [Plasmodium falciparum NF54]|uniref:NAA35-like N-terminal domain-containing protein n=3 Tax=Plasmodium falciparum TaxID=5833 RepID=Q8I338_PLAF7|nr:conserved Plasmodium protein, unknown function [Plasmodium falciparum 3D7]ETW61713.1 hypothetical protein PFMC_02365 [Plasmodium falciparum CAMP/Malaysia]KAF4330793.1 hypothetical protein CYL21_1169 [Plasmodium falciparum NF54]PKC44995.1 hypothetical protein CK202_3985 [Plasmodium falciparum NF54]CAD51797.1 conserved Plasmodium protein, unknown function [Plasmodium falciparum 3D7]|eukprot:XP_001351986.1 conserved Plasmodium protein, unknown function [Plasmodium falciparum 3D7]